MPRKRNPENRGLPARWCKRHGAYYYQVPPGFEGQWDGKKLFRLGKTLPEAHREWANRIDVKDGTIRTLADLFDRYAFEVVPTKAPSTRQGNTAALRNLRAVFGHFQLAKGDKQCVLEAHHAYQYLDKRPAKNTKSASKGGKVAAKREIEVLSHALTMAVEWGLIRRNPLTDKNFSTKGKVPTEGRDRYVTDEEIKKVLKLSRGNRKKGSVLMIQAYIKIKLLTGMRMTDMLLLKVDDIDDEGVNLRPRKTAKTTRKELIIEWTAKLKEAVNEAKAARPNDQSPYLFCNRLGESYFNTQTGAANGFQSIWQRFMARVLEETEVEESFAERDLRAKAASDIDSLEHAMSLLGHTDPRTTKKWYRRKAERVKPSKGV